MLQLNEELILLSQIFLEMLVFVGDALSVSTHMLGVTFWCWWYLSKVFVIVLSININAWTLLGLHLNSNAICPQTLWKICIDYKKCINVLNLLSCTTEILPLHPTAVPHVVWVLFARISCESMLFQCKAIFPFIKMLTVASSREHGGRGVICDTVQQPVTQYDLP